MASIRGWHMWYSDLSGAVGWPDGSGLYRLNTIKIISFHTINVYFLDNANSSYIIFQFINIHLSEEELAGFGGLIYNLLSTSSHFRSVSYGTVHALEESVSMSRRFLIFIISFSRPGRRWRKLIHDYDRCSVNRSIYQFRSHDSNTSMGYISFGGIHYISLQHTFFLLNLGDHSF